MLSTIDSELADQVDVALRQVYGLSEADAQLSIFLRDWSLYTRSYEPVKGRKALQSLTTLLKDASSAHATEALDLVRKWIAGYIERYRLLEDRKLASFSTILRLWAALLSAPDLRATAIAEAQASSRAHLAKDTRSIDLQLISLCAACVEELTLERDVS